jgi:cytochrome c556
MAEEILNGATGTEAGAEGTNGGSVEQPGKNRVNDYDKIQQILDGTLKAKEDTVLKSYFKQMGLSQEDAEKAIADFKATKKEHAPDVDGLNAQIKAKDDEIASLHSKLTQILLTGTVKDLADELGFEASHTKYIMKNAELDDVIKEDGTVDTDKVKEAVTKFLEEVPNFKKVATTNHRSFKPDNVGNPKPDAPATVKPKTVRGKIDAIFN